MNSVLNWGEIKAFWVWWRQSLFLQMNSAYPFSDVTTPFFQSDIGVDQNVDCITLTYPFTSSLYFSVFFQMLFECGTQPVAEYALRPLCNAETQGIVYLKDRVI